MRSEVQVLLDPPSGIRRPWRSRRGALAQLGERLICIQEVTGSIPVGSTKILRILVPPTVHASARLWCDRLHNHLCVPVSIRDRIIEQGVTPCWIVLSDGTMSEGSCVQLTSFREIHIGFMSIRPREGVSAALLRKCGKI